MNRSDYVVKMHDVLNDKSKYHCRFDELTVERERENNLTNLLRRLQKDRHITEDFDNLARPGLSKLYKKPLRPIISCIGIFNYGLDKALSPMLSPILQKTNTALHSLIFVEELKRLSKSLSSRIMVTFDISSLYSWTLFCEICTRWKKHLHKSNKTIGKSFCVSLQKNFTLLLMEKFTSKLMESPWTLSWLQL